MVGVAEKHAGRVGKRRGRRRKQTPQAIETLALERIGRILRLVRTGEMAHDEPDVQARQPFGMRRQLLDFGRRHAEPRHAAVHLKHGRQRTTQSARQRGPAVCLFEAVEHRRDAGFRGIGFGAGGESVQDIDCDIAVQGLPQGERFRELRREEVRAALAGQRVGDRDRTDAVAVCLDDAGTVGVAKSCFENPVVLAERGDVDGENGASDDFGGVRLR